MNAEAGAEEGQAGADRLRDQRLFSAEPGKFLLVVDAHGPAHRNDRVEFAPVGEWLAFVELDPVDPGAALDQDVLIDAGRLAGDVLEDERLHAQRGVTVTSTPCTDVLSPMSARSPGLRAFTFAPAGSRFGQRPFGE